jgi:hypothetical protein
MEHLTVAQIKEVLQQKNLKFKKSAKKSELLAILKDAANTAASQETRSFRGEY